MAESLLDPIEQESELARLDALRSLDLLDTPREQEYDELVQLASEVCGTPISLVSLVDANRQWFKAAIGLAAKETPRNVSFCSHAIQRPGLFVIENAEQDPRFQNNSLVTGAPGIRFYAGMPLHSPNGHAVGTLCVIDTVPRTLTQSQKNALTILGGQVETRMELRAKQKSLEAALKQNDRLYTELRTQNNLFLAFMNNGPFVSYIKDGDGRMVFYNDRLAERFGVTTHQWVGLLDREIWPPHVAEELRRNDLAILNANELAEIAEEIPAPDGTLTHWRSYKFPFHNQNGEPMLAGMSIDVTGQLQQQAELNKALQEKMQLAASLESSTLLFQTFVDKNPNICFFKSRDGKYLAYNARFAELFGIDMQAWIGKTDQEARPGPLADRIREMDIRILNQEEVFEYPWHMENAAGQTVWHKSFKFPISTADGNKILAGVAIDITPEILKEHELSRANAKLEELATTDALTGLCNRRSFEERIAAAFALSTRRSLPLSLIIMDIDNFKKRNDTYGHAAGDNALRALATVLSSGMRTGDVAARIGGEEFAMLLTGTDLTGASILAERMRSRLRAADCGPGGELTVSMGIAALSAGTRDWEQLISHADNAMYEAKRAGKNRFVLSTESDPPVQDKTD